MYRGTTPTHKFCFGIVNPNDFKEILITYMQNEVNVLEKHKQDLVITSEDVPSGEETVTYYHATIQLTQEEANLFNGDRGKPVYIQMRGLDYLGNVLASNKMQVSVIDVLNDEVLS